MYEDNCFITLTYNDKHLPYGGTLVKKHYQDFMKRLRQHYEGKKIRYFHCGEYGEESSRPHYHACLFNLDFKDKELYSEKDGIRLYTSETLEKIWKKGFCTLGDVTFESAAYVARYIMKKVTGDKAEDHYKSLDPETGELFKIEPEYTTMSRNPGLGKKWFEEFKDDVYPGDFVVVNGTRCRPPRYYDNLLDRVDAEALEERKRERKKRGNENAADNTRERLEAKEKVKKAQIGQLKRSI